MKLNDAQRLLLIVIMAASLAASFAFGNTQSGASQQSVAPSAEIFAYSQAQYALNAPAQVNEQAF